MFRRLFEYEYWADREALASLAALAGSANGAGDRALRFFNHIIGANRVWLDRLEQRGASAAQPWPTLTLEECREAPEETNRRWGAYLKRVTPEGLSQDIVYRNTKGVEFATLLQDILMHLVTHSAYHRGQVAAAVREAGGKPAATDYVVWVRQVKARQ